MSNEHDDLILLHIELQTQLLAEIASQLRKAETVDPDTAIVAFGGWLTSRKEVSGPFSSHHNAGDMAQLIRQFCEAQGWKASDERFHRQIQAMKEYPGD